MTEDHEFVDSTNAVEQGKSRCVEIWQGFFAQFPDYRNSFTRLVTRGETVSVEGYSTCATPALDGPALWRATTRAGKVAQWRVYEDTPANRLALGISDGR